MPNGIVIIDKPQGWTSMDVCAKLRGILHEKRVGHAGTLDPMATGVLPVFVGQATKAVSFAEGGQKVYEAVLQLGLVTDTQDTTGETLEERAVAVTENDVRAALPRFLGEIEQIPPMYSAIKVNGQKLYDLARQGREVARKPRMIAIFDLALTRLYGGAAPHGGVKLPHRRGRDARGRAARGRGPAPPHGQPVPAVSGLHHPEH